MDEILAEADKLADGCRTGPVLMGHLQVRALALVLAELEGQTFYLREAFEIYNHRFR